MKNHNLTLDEAAKLLGVSRQTVWNMIQRGSLNGFKLDPTAKSIYFVPREEVEHLLKQWALSVGKRTKARA